jgi:FKBP-type peptidyl-prolyl cis-trans isomerase
MEVPLGRVIQGWNEVLQLMKPGAIYRVTIPPSLGYGARPAGPKIPANSTLVFYVNLVGPAAGE